MTRPPGAATMDHRFREPVVLRVGDGIAGRRVHGSFDGSTETPPIPRSRHRWVHPVPSERMLRRCGRSARRLQPPFPRREAHHRRPHWSRTGGLPQGSGRRTRSPSGCRVTLTGQPSATAPVAISNAKTLPVPPATYTSPAERSRTADPVTPCIPSGNSSQSETTDPTSLCHTIRPSSASRAKNKPCAVPTKSRLDDRPWTLTSPATTGGA